MLKVTVIAYGSVSKEADWGHSKEVNFEQEKITVEDVLKSVTLKDGRLLFDLIGDENGIKDSYTVMLNGLILQSSKDLKKEVKDKDIVTALDFFRFLIGG